MNITNRDRSQTQSCRSSTQQEVHQVEKEHQVDSPVPVERQEPRLMTE